MRLANRWRPWQEFFLGDFRALAWMYVLMVLLATCLQYFPAPQVFDNHPVTHYNNFVIFKRSFFHLLEGTDLYMHYWDEQYDLFKYSPTFPILFGPLAILPDFPGLLLWNALNAGLLWLAFRKLPLETRSVNIALMLFVLPELFTSMQNSQSNGLMAALLILCFICFESRKLFLAALCLALGFYVKIFAIVGVILFCFYPGKAKFLSYLFFWFVILALLPLAVTSGELLIYQYQSWLGRLSADYTDVHEYSVMSWLRIWFGVDWPNAAVQAAGAALFCAPLIGIKSYADRHFRLVLLSSLLIWVVIFNHSAESPTFVIAMSGVGLWFLVQPRSLINRILVVLAFFFASVVTMDILPRWLYDDFVRPYVLKGAFCILVWFKVTFDLMVYPGSQAVIRERRIS